MKFDGRYASNLHVICLNSFRKHLQIPAGSLVAVVGATGSGKSSLLSAALGLMEQTRGPPVELHGKVT